MENWLAGEGQKWKVDVAGIPKRCGRPLVLIEIELKKDNPVENVVNIWRWAMQEKSLSECCLYRRFLPITKGRSENNMTAQYSLANG